VPKFQEDAVLLEQHEVAERTHRLRLRCQRIAAAARAGQFLMLQVRSGSEPLLKRPFSFHRILPREGCIEILYRVTGQGTWWLSQGRPGTRLNAVGPLGNGFDLPDWGQRVVALVAGGIGIAPFDQLMTDLMAAPPSGGHDVHLFYGARTAVEMVPVHPYERLGVTVHLSTDDGSRGDEGVVTRLFELTTAVDRLRPGLLYGCGPLTMQARLAAWALAAGIPAQLSLEALMACGIGACLGCALPTPHQDDPSGDNYLHVCKDGPIFPAGSIAWHRLQRHPISPRIFRFD